ncbi:M56 family metallopeptidase [Candidatus Palauibacter sp.]|uniref:M56 family metallopeptidase n=1 Tax=Candidatus Palauibacter sp. TaxID=3101350 RepID=UPI003B017F4E
MTLATMIYGLIVAALVGGAAWFLDRGLRGVGRPTRWVWIGALVIGGLAPFLPRFLPAAATADGPGPLSIPVYALYELGTPASPLPEQSGSLLAGIGLEDPLGTLWILGSILVLVLFALFCLRLRRLRARCEPRDVCGEQVLRSDGFGPAVVGLIRSRIVLPSWTFGLGERELEMVVLHEREHVRARDPALLAAGLLLASISPWNPAVWWSLARLRLAVEGDCDRRVLARGTSARSYARLLLTVAAGCRRTPGPAPALIRGGHSAIERRLMMIKTATRKPRIRASILTAAAGVGLFALACDTPVPQSPGEPERPSLSEGVINSEGVISSGTTGGPEPGEGLKAGVGYVGYVDEDGTFQWLDRDPEAGGLYVDEDGTFRLELDPEAGARIRRTLEERAATLEALKGRLQESKVRLEALEGHLRPAKITNENTSRDLWINLESSMESLSELLPRLEEMTTEMAMVSRRLQTAVEAGEITHEEAEQMLQTHMAAHNARLRPARQPDRQR